MKTTFTLTVTLAQFHDICVALQVSAYDSERYARRYTHVLNKIRQQVANQTVKHETRKPKGNK